MSVIAPKTYQVREVPSASIALDGILDEPEWSRAELLTDFTFPWEERDAPRTEFRAFCDDTSLYFGFTAWDDDVVVVESAPWDKRLVDGEDRVELFFAADPELRNYYCAEMDPLGRVHDFHASFHRKFDDSWSFPGLRLAAKCLPTGYAVEGSIPLQALRSLGVLVGRDMRVGVYRAEFDHGPGGTPIEHWLSWVDPETPGPEFHVPSSFGAFRLVE